MDKFITWVIFWNYKSKESMQLVRKLTFAEPQGPFPSNNPFSVILPLGSQTDSLDKHGLFLWKQEFISTMHLVLLCFVLDTCYRIKVLKYAGHVSYHWAIPSHYIISYFNFVVVVVFLYNDLSDSTCTLHILLYLIYFLKFICFYSTVCIFTCETLCAPCEGRHLGQDKCHCIH